MAEIDVGVTREEAVHAAKHDMNFFGALAIPEVFRYLFPPIFLAVWQLLTSAAQKEKGQDKLAVGLPRGIGKTIILKLFVVWAILFTDRKFILVVCNTAALAENFIADVSDILSSINIIRVFGDWRFSQEKDTLELKKFSFRGRNVILAGLGQGSSLRGLNIKFVRPDFIIMDDMQSREQAASEVESKKVLSWMMGTLMKANDKARCLFVFLGNNYPYEGAILRKLRKNPAWISFVCGAILADGESIWPELRSVESILEELEDDTAMGHPEIFFSEVMNDDVAGSVAGIDFDKINVWRDDPDHPIYPQAGFILIDPASGKKKGNDVAIGAYYIYDGEPVLQEVLTDKYSPGDQVDYCIKLALKYNISAIVLESVAYQSTLGYWLAQRVQQLGMRGMKILEITPQGLAKNSRIQTALKQLTAQKQRLWITPEVRSAVIHKITCWDPTKTNNDDDLLDLLGYAYIVLATHRHSLLLFFDLEQDAVRAITQPEMELDF